MDMIAAWGTPLLILAAVLALYMAWGIGARDVPATMGTSLGSGGISVKRAIIVAVLFEFAGALIAGGEVTATIGGKIIDSRAMAAHPQQLVLGMLAALLAAALWLKIAEARAWPVSTTHTMIGAIVGVAVLGIGSETVQWGTLTKIAASWVIAPILSGFLALLLITSVRKLILSADDPFTQAKRWGPGYLFVLGWTIALAALSGGVPHLDFELTSLQTALAAMLAGVVTALTGGLLIRQVRSDAASSRGYSFAGVERVFMPMVIFSAAAMAFAHGSNDVGNAIGPLAAVVSVIGNAGQGGSPGGATTWVMLLGAAGIIVGLLTMGYRVIQSAGTRITELTPTRGFCATLAAAGTVAVASKLGLPVSTTHVVVGAFMGVGLARGIGALDLRVIGNIIVSWAVTLPAAALLAAIFYFILTFVFG